MRRTDDHEALWLEPTFWAPVGPRLFVSIDAIVPGRPSGPLLYGAVLEHGQNVGEKITQEKLTSDLSLAPSHA
jgi:hypothetical protein